MTEVKPGRWRRKSDHDHVDTVTRIDENGRVRYLCQFDRGTDEEDQEWNSTQDFWVKEFEPVEAEEREEMKNKEPMVGEIWKSNASGTSYRVELVGEKPDGVGFVRATPVDGQGSRVGKEAYGFGLSHFMRQWDKVADAPEPRRGPRRHSFLPNVGDKFRHASGTQYTVTAVRGAAEDLRIHFGRNGSDQAHTYRLNDFNATFGTEFFVAADDVEPTTEADWSDVEAKLKVWKVAKAEHKRLEEAWHQAEIRLRETRNAYEDFRKTVDEAYAEYAVATSQLEDSL